MKCKKYQKLISAQIDGELSQSEEKKLKEHLALCPKCVKELELLKGFSDNLEPEPVPESLYKDLAGRVLRKFSCFKSEFIKRNRKRARRFMRAFSVIGVLLFLSFSGFAILYATSRHRCRHLDSSFASGYAEYALSAGFSHSRCLQMMDYSKKCLENARKGCALCEEEK